MEYKGASHEASRAATLEKARTKMLADFQQQKDQIAKDKTVSIGQDKFVGQNDWVDDELKRQTIGLVALEDFQKIRENLDKKRQEEIDKGVTALYVEWQTKQKRKKKKEKVKLSFGMDDEGNGDDDAATSLPKKVKKDPTVDTSFLPDKEREAVEQQERDSLKAEWLASQEKIKTEKILITYSYWDGSGHRKQVECKKGDTVGQFLENCRQQWHQLRGVNVDNMMYIKEDLIVPH
ncbi:XAP5, circadian clock regulator-domain-containing protein, partial [Blyttiomyces helicus]